MIVPDFPIVDEMAQFASFPDATRTYIAGALALSVPKESGTLTGNVFDKAMQLARLDVYSSIPVVRERISAKDYNLETWSTEFGLLHRYALFDLQYDEMSDFKAFVFLYERLLGPAVRPWLLSIYLSAAGSPRLTEEGREKALSGITASDVAFDFVHTPAPKYFPGID